MISLLLGLGGSLIDWIVKLQAMMQLKHWMAVASCALTLILGIKLLTSIFEFLKSLMASKIARWALGLLTVLGLGFSLGYLSKPTENLSKSGEKIQHIHVQKKDSMTRTKNALVIDGKIYYPAKFINEHLKAKGSKERFREVYP